MKCALVSDNNPTLQDIVKILKVHLGTNSQNIPQFVLPCFFFVSNEVQIKKGSITQNNELGFYQVAVFHIANIFITKTFKSIFVKQ